MKKRFAIIAALGSTQTLAWASSFYLPAVLGAPIAHDIGLSTPWTYAALSFGLGVSALLGPSLGHYIDHHGGRPILCGSNLAFAGGLCLFAASTGPLSLMLAWLVLGIAMAAGLYEAAFASLTRMYGHGSRGAITGITLLAGFASTIGWPASALLEHSFGWRGACLAWAGMHLCVGLPLNAWALRDEKSVLRDAGDIERAEALPTWNNSMWVLAFVFTASGMVTIGLAANLPLLFVAVGASPPAAIAAASLLGPVQVVARILEFSARHRIDPLASARIANVLHPLGAAVIALGGAPVVAAFAVLHGAGSGMLTITRGTLPLALYGPHGYGARVGRIAAPARVGQALSPFIFSVAIAKLGVVTLAISSGLSCAALIGLYQLSLPRKAERRNEAP
ncbi:MAG: MFS transporter [Gammaproteobacteria bacterium]